MKEKKQRAGQNHGGGGPRVSLQTLKVLKVMMENPTSDYYGLELTERAGIKSGTLYPVLIRLERHGWLESDWENIDPRVAGRRPRRYYRLTPFGLKRAREELTDNQAFFSRQPGWVS